MNRTVFMAAVLAAGVFTFGGCLGCPSLPTPKPNPMLAITKEAPAQASVGQEFAYAIHVTNPGDATTRNILLTDVLPEGIQYVSSNPGASVEGQTLRWKLGDLAARAAKDERRVEVTVRATRTGTFWNTASVVADGELKADAKARTVVTQAQLVLRLTGPDEVLICDPIPYKLTVSNPGDAPAKNVRLSCQLPEGLAAEGAEVFKNELGTLDAGASREMTFRARASKSGPHVYKVSATGDGLRADAEAKTLVRQAMLAVTMKAPARRFINRDIPVEITVANQGDGAAQGVSVTGTVPAGTAFESAGQDGKAGAGRVVWGLGDLAAGASATVSMKLRATTKGSAAHAATAVARCAEASAQAQTEVSGIAAILLENWDDPDPVEVGGQTTYTIRVTNQGSADDKNVVISCVLPDEESLVSATGPTENTVDGQKVTFAAVRSLGPKDKVEYKIVVKGLKPGDVRFKVFLTSDMMTSPVEKSESTHIYQ